MAGIRNWLGEVWENERTRGKVGNGRQKMRGERETKEGSFGVGRKGV